MDNTPFIRSSYVYKTENGIYLERCPDCGRENYAPAVASGICSWCGYDANDVARRKEDDYK